MHGMNLNVANARLGKEAVVDLHTHTTKSDGSLTPSELVQLAISKKVKILSITDHETVSGIDEAYEAVGDSETILIPGIETSVEFHVEMHILGYFSKNNYKKIEPLAHKLRQGRLRRNLKIVDRLCELKMPVTLEEINKHAVGGIASRPHIARTLVDKGYTKSMKEAFDRYLYNGGPAYFKRYEVSPRECIGEILEAGGIPVLAHPILMGMGWKQLDQAIEELKNMGLMGLEVYYSENMGDDTGKLMRIALRHGLIATGGSDFHGTYKPHIDIGIGRGKLSVPIECGEKLLEMLPGREN